MKTNGASWLEPEEVLIAATGRSSLTEALLWLAEDHPISSELGLPSLLQAIVKVAGSDEASERAIRRVVRDATSSGVDTSQILFDPEELPNPRTYRTALEDLLSYSADGTFGGLTPRALVRAQYANSLSIEVLCLCAGVAFGDACQWFLGGSTRWREHDAEALLNYLNGLVGGSVESPIPGSVAARGIEHFANGGWAVSERFMSDGVPFEVLLAQRAGGGVWGLHKNKTSTVLNRAIAEALVALLVDRDIRFLRSSTVGGDSKPTDLQALTGVHDKRVSLVVLRDGEPLFLVGFSSAKDGGTARANGDGLLSMPKSRLPMAFVLTGLGWSGRAETDRLARRFDGLLFTEKTLSELVDRIEAELS